MMPPIRHRRVGFWDRHPTLRSWLFIMGVALASGSVIVWFIP